MNGKRISDIPLSSILFTVKFKGSLMIGLLFPAFIAISNADDKQLHGYFFSLLMLVELELFLYLLSRIENALLHPRKCLNKPKLSDPLSNFDTENVLRINL